MDAASYTRNLTPWTDFQTSNTPQQEDEKCQSGKGPSWKKKQNLAASCAKTCRSIVPQSYYVVAQQPSLNIGPAWVVSYEAPVYIW